LLEKLDRVEDMYKKENSIPELFWNILNEQRIKLNELKEKNGDILSPSEF